MSSTQLPRFGNRTTLGIWLGVGFLGGAIALGAVLSLAASRGYLPVEIAMADDHIGRVFMTFIAGVSLDCLALWGIYSSALVMPEGDFQS